MTRFAPDEIKTKLGSGLLCFPVSHATDELAFDEEPFREHLGWLSGFEAAGTFVAGGTGEFFSLTRDDVSSIVRAGVAEAKPEVPVIAPAGYGTAIAVEMAKDAEAAGADGVFLLPPYLTEVDQSGLVEHVRRVCQATDLGVIAYHRANARFSADSVRQLVDECPNFIGFKDGVGEIDLMSALYATVGDRLLFIGGLPTAETFALPYLELGVTTYSSAIFNFAPKWATDFYNAVRRRDHDEVYGKLRDFVLPYLDIRNRRAGYSVSIVKAGVSVVGRPAGPVRPPLTDLTKTDYADLSDLIKKVS